MTEIENPFEPPHEYAQAQPGQRVRTVEGMKDVPETEPEPQPHRLRVVSFAKFISVTEASARPLLGTEENNVLPAGGTLVQYGDGGASKTSQAVDAVAHMAAGVPWLGLAVEKPVRILVIENEGPRGLFRKKLEAKEAAWDGPPFGDNVHIVEEPWAQVSFADVRLQGELVYEIEEGHFELIVAGPVARLGMKGGGTLDEVGAFMGLIAAIRGELQVPLAVWLTHHENKAGEVSGAWEGEPDTLIHVRRDGKDRSLLRWEKTRWAPGLHGHRWTLAWLPGERYEIVDDGERNDEVREAEEAEALEWIVAYVEKHPGATRGSVEEAFHQAHGGKGRNLARRVIGRELQAAEVLAAEGLDARGTGENFPRLARGSGERVNGTYLYPSNHAFSPLADALFSENGENGSQPPVEASSRQLAAPVRGSGERRVREERVSE